MDERDEVETDDPAEAFVRVTTAEIAENLGSRRNFGPNPHVREISVGVDIRDI